MAQNKTKNLKLSLFFDWVMILVILVATSAVNKIRPVKRQFALDDITISHPSNGDTIKMVYLLPFCLVSSFIIITFFQMFKKRLGFNYHQAIIGFLFSYFLTGFIGNVFKSFVGRLRPDFLTVCKPDLAMVEQIYNSYNLSPGINYGPRYLFDASICTGLPEDVDKERSSFPSSHTYTAFCTMTYIALYIAGQIHLLDKKSYVWKYIVVSIPFIFSAIVAMTRVFDYRHHWEDVAVGGLIGLVIGTLTYFYYFPSLSDPNCDIPHQCRKEDKSNENKRQEYIVYN